MTTAEPEARTARLRAVRQDTVVDIAATSRHGPGLPDTATVTTTLVLDAKEGDRVLRLVTQVPVFERDDGTYRFTLTVPADYAELVKDGEVNVVAIAPPGTELVDATADPAPRDFQAGDRMGLAWNWRQDPDLDWIYRYLRL